MTRIGSNPETVTWKPGKSSVKGLLNHHHLLHVLSRLFYVHTNLSNKIDDGFSSSIHLCPFSVCVSMATPLLSLCTYNQLPHYSKISFTSCFNSKPNFHETTHSRKTPDFVAFHGAKKLLKKPFLHIPNESICVYPYHSSSLQMGPRESFFRRRISVNSTGADSGNTSTVSGNVS